MWMPYALVRGIGDVGSAVAHRLFREGFGIVLHDAPQPTATRRGMAFVDAVFDGSADLAGVRAVRVDDLTNLPEILATRTVIPLVVTDVAALLATTHPHVLIDAWMRKRVRPGAQRGLVPLTIGLGPGFVAGETVDVAIETSWEALGAVIQQGPTLTLAGEPRPLGRHGRGRYVYAPHAGLFQTKRAIGDSVVAGEHVACLDDAALLAPLAGRLRGLTHSGVPVAVGTKVIEVDPRGEHAGVVGIGGRPLASPRES
jgi:xanthine dehydrogenase accessory factor